jgi:tRNA (pseudouridine54-N1)-methyltransferase
MRRFVIVGHRAVTSGDFKLDDLAGSAGRLDILLRCINSAFFLSHDIRKDVEAYLILQGPPSPPKTIRLVGSELRYLNPDERSTAALVRNALLRSAEGEVRSSPGIYISSSSFAEIVSSLARLSRLIYLKETGAGQEQIDLKCDLTFVLSDNQDLSVEEEKILMQNHPQTINIGPVSYHSDHCIVLVHSILDRSQADQLAPERSMV